MGRWNIIGSALAMDSLGKMMAHPGKEWTPEEAVQEMEGMERVGANTLAKETDVNHPGVRRTKIAFLSCRSHIS